MLDVIHIRKAIEDAFTNIKVIEDPRTQAAIEAAYNTIKTELDLPINKAIDDAYADIKADTTSVLYLAVNSLTALLDTKLISYTATNTTGTINLMSEGTEKGTGKEILLINDGAADITVQTSSFTTDITVKPTDPVFRMSFADFTTVTVTATTTNYRLYVFGKPYSA